jgi:glutamate racemase
VSDPRPIGVFDSGVGGLTVLREILRRTPAESTIYLGDNARAPYGTRPDDEVRAFSTESIDALVARDVKAVVVACNTSTAVALGDLRRRYDLPVLGVIRPGAVTASLTTRNRRVGVIATPATIRSHAYFAAIKDENPAVEVYEHATPALVPMVEAGLLTGAAVDAAVGDALAPLLGERDTAGDFVFPLPASARIDTLLLGCTHYPLLRAALERAAGEGIAIVDSASATASALADLLSINGLEAPAGGEGSAASPVHVQLTTGDVEVFRSIAKRMFGDAFPDVAGIELGRPATAAAGGRAQGPRPASASETGSSAGAAATSPASGVGSTR